MSLFDDFGRLQDTVNALMGDFGTRQGARHGGRRRGGRGGWGDVTGMEEWMGLDPFMEAELYSMPLLAPSQGLGQPGVGQGKLAEETKMDESAGPSALTTQQGGQLAQRQPGALPVLRCRVNIEDAKDQYKITAEVPGFDKENLKVNISDSNVLTIEGTQRKEHVEESKEKKYIRTERSFGRVQRSLQLPKNVSKENISASYENGILHVNVPKLELQAQKQEVQIS